MARMFPPRWLFGSDRSLGREAERSVFEALTTLPQDFAVYHGIQFQIRRENDPRLHDVEIDFLITHSVLGTMILEVKAGAIDVRARAWGRTDRGRWAPMDDPVVQLRDHKHDLMRHLRLDPRWRWPQFDVFGALAFPGRIEGWPAGLTEVPRPMIACAADLTRMHDWLLHCFRYYSLETPPPGAHPVARLIHSQFDPTITIGDSFRGVGDSVADSEDRIRGLTEQQLTALNGLRNNRRVAVSGPAGSGKTILAMKRASELAADGVGRVLYTCYNQPLARHVGRELLDAESVTVLNFHKLIERMAKDAQIDWTPPGPASGPAAQREWWTEGVVGIALDALNVRPDLAFDAVIVDEAQDFYENWWPVLELLLRDARKSRFWVFSDDNQRIYSHASSIPDDLFHFQLSENLRNTQRIASTFQHLVDIDRATPRGPAGEPVQWIALEASSTPIVQLESIVRRLIEQGIEDGEIMILTSRGNERTVLRERSALAGRPFGQLNPSVERSTLRWETVRRFKGLESPVIVLFELDDLEAHENRELAYVALSRASSLLIVLGHKEQIRALRSI